MGSVKGTERAEDENRQSSGPQRFSSVLVREELKAPLLCFSSHAWSSGPPSWWNPNHCSARSADTNLSFLVFFFFIFTSVKWNSKYSSVGEVIFIIIIILNIIVSRPWCFVVY